MQGIVVRNLKPEEIRNVLADVRHLYESAGWMTPDADGSFLEPMLRNSFRVTGAFDNGRLIGMMRALSDGVSDAYLLDMVVEPGYRHRGIAGAIVDALTGEIKKHGIDWIVCISVPGVDKLYLRKGDVMKDHVPIRFRISD